ncbi:MAG: porin [Verrucomicrobiae bacterium]|nr:porin [Verrucomicrobiae bacterium]
MKLKNLLSGALAFALCHSSVNAGEEATEKKIKELEAAIEDQGIYVETSQKGIVLSGYVDTSYTYNFNGGGTSAGGKEITDVSGVGNDSQDFSLNAVKLALEKALPEENELAAGFRIDLMMGEDWQDSTETGVFVEQAYVQFRVPVGNGLDFRFGKMIPLLGYEAYERPANDNFSYGLLFTYAYTGFDTGIDMTYSFTDWLSATLRFANTDGDDSGFYDNSDVSKSISGSINFTAPGENADLALLFYYAPEGTANYNVPVRVDGEETFIENDQAVIFNMYGSWLPKMFNDKLKLAFDAAIGFTQDNYLAADSSENNASFWGIGLYAKYQFTKVFSLAGRAEYLHDSDGTAKAADSFEDGFDFRDSPIYTSQTDLYSWTLTAGFDIWENLLTRIEYRLDVASSDDANNAFNNDQSTQHTLSFNMAYQF